MDISTLTQFFKYCTIINGLLLVMMAIMMRLNLIYNVHTKLGFWKGSEKDHKQVMYSLIGNYKILWWIFNLVPYLVLCCIIS